MSIWIIIYNIVFLFLVTVSSPLWTVLVIYEKKWREIFMRRAWLELPANMAEFRGGIWIHALSVGEVLSSEPLVRKFSEKTGKPVIVSVSTFTGHETALRLFGKKNVAVVYFPFDFIWSVKKAFDFIRPEAVIIIENDIWPNFVWFAKKAGVSLIWSNARVSDRSFHRYHAFGKITGDFFCCFDLVFAQSLLDRIRLEKIGVKNNKIIRTGNLKFDRDYNAGIPDGLNRKQLLGLDENSHLFVCGSTHEGEEEIILEAYEKVRGIYPDLVFVIAPRNPERAIEIAVLSGKRGIRTCLLSNINDNEGTGIIVVDCLGKLLEIYSVSDAAFIGGSLLQYGGHNPLEPASFEKPVFFGPFMNDFREISDNLISSGGAVKVFSAEDLSENLVRLFSDSTMAEEMGKKAFFSSAREQGVSDQIMTSLGTEFPELFR